MVTHYIPAYTVRNGTKQQAICGLFIGAAAHSIEPTCHTCSGWLTDALKEERRLEEQFGDDVMAQAEGLFGGPNETPNVFARDPEFNPTAGYAPKGSRR